MATPELRFVDEDGKDYPDWENEKLEDVFNILPTKNFSRSELTKEKTKVANIHYGDIHTKFPTLLDMEKEEISYIKDGEDLSNIKKEAYLKDGDLVIADVSEDRKDVCKRVVIKRLPKDAQALAGLHTFLARDENNKTVLSFRPLLFENSETSNYIARVSTGASVVGISKTNLLKMPLLLPSLPEQQKIANLFSLIDEKIENLGKQVYHWKQYKQGLSQQLFTQQLRFVDEDGNAYPDWEEKKLGDILAEYSRKTKTNNELPVLSSTKDALVLQSEYFNRDVASKNNIGYKIVEVDTLVLSPQNLWLGNININKRAMTGMVSPSYRTYEIDKNICKVYYLNQIIKTKKMLQEYMLASEQGASVVRRNLDQDLFKKIKLQVPSLPEQEKIANLLSSVDSKIENLEYQENEWKLYKQALMQKMFV